MSLLKKSGIWLCILGIICMHTSVHAGMVDTSELLLHSERSQWVDMLEREDVQQKLMEMGIDHELSVSRVNQMTNEEIAQLNDHFSELPVGAGLTTVELLLIIILIIVLI